LNDVVRGIAQKGTLGYWISEPYARQGLMREAAELVLRFAYEDLKLHRVEAACLPDNEASRHLLLSLGFIEEGLALAYLRINGQWEDHVLWGRVGPW
jgi:ribosomal-protein-alanine N-acetyltransferase